MATDNMRQFIRAVVFLKETNSSVDWSTSFDDEYCEMTVTFDLSRMSALDKFGFQIRCLDVLKNCKVGYIHFANDKVVLESQAHRSNRQNNSSEC